MKLSENQATLVFSYMPMSLLHPPYYSTYTCTFLVNLKRWFETLNPKEKPNPKSQKGNQNPNWLKAPLDFVISFPS